jgi:ribosomal protein S18 acetylase RimI-like enzyme
VREIFQATTAEHFELFHQLVAEFRAWDSARSREIGLDFDTVVAFLYEPAPDTAAEYAPNGRVFLARHDGEIAGCGALKELSPGVAELTRVYVRPAFRGKGLGKAIVERTLASANEGGYAEVRLETAIFMTDAQALYRSLGFQLVPPFRSVPEELKEAEVFMALRLRGRAPS